MIFTPPIAAMQGREQTTDVEEDEYVWRRKQYKWTAGKFA